MPMINTNETVRIDLPTEGEWAEVQKALTVGQREAIGAAGKAMVRMSKVSGDSEMQIIEAAVERATFLALEMTIKRWSYGVPVTGENLRKLDGETFDALVKACNELWEPRSDDERKNSSPPSASTTAETAHGLLRLAESA